SVAINRQPPTPEARPTVNVDPAASPLIPIIAPAGALLSETFRGSASSALRNEAWLTMNWAAGCFARPIGVSGVGCPRVCGGKGAAGGGEGSAGCAATSAITDAGPPELVSPAEPAFASTGSGVACDIGDAAA